MVATEAYLCIQDKRLKMEANRQRKPRWQKATVTAPLDWPTHFSFKVPRAQSEKTGRRYTVHRCSSCHLVSVRRKWASTHS